MEDAHFPKEPAHTGLTILDRLPKKKDGSSAVLKIALEKEGEKRKKMLLQHGVFVIGHPPKY